MYTNSEHQQPNKRGFSTDLLLSPFSLDGDGFDLFAAEDDGVVPMKDPATQNGGWLRKQPQMTSHNRGGGATNFCYAIYKGVSKIATLAWLRACKLEYLTAIRPPIKADFQVIFE